MVKYDYNDYFIKLPNNLIWACEKDEISLVKAIGSKTTMVLSSLVFRCNPLGICGFTLEDLIIELGYTPKTGKGKINEQIKGILIELEKIGYIENIGFPICDIKGNTFVKFKINNNIPLNEKGEEVNFFKLYYKDFEKMININHDCKKDVLLNSYCYISSRIKHRAKDDRTESYGMRTEGKAEYTYFTYEEAMEDLTVVEATFKENIDILAELKLIAFDNVGLIKKNDKIRVANNVYVVDIEELDYAINDSKFYYEENGYEVLGKKTNESTKKIIGLNSRINQLNAQGKDTAKLNKKLEKLEKERERKRKKKQKEVNIENLREEVRKLCIDNIERVGNYTREWNNKYNTTVLDCEDTNKLLELKDVVMGLINKESSVV